MPRTSLDDEVARVRGAPGEHHFPWRHGARGSPRLGRQEDVPLRVECGPHGETNALVRLRRKRGEGFARARGVDEALGGAASARFNFEACTVR